ncbi:MAG: N-acetylneuraminate synthase family protein [Bryobacterales bacterium]|nr:N-acetylneuraminate synthase family protein [Bryobacterales bacterium]
MTEAASPRVRFQLGRDFVGEGCPAFVIAEIGINHNGDFNRAKELMDSAKAAGANAVKLQTYLTEKRVARDSPIFGILKQCEIPFADQRRLFEYADSIGATCFSTPFDDESVDFLTEVGAPCFKIASFDVVNLPLLRRAAAKERPMIVSRGMASREELDRAVEIMRAARVAFALLHCVSAYPVKSLGDLNLSTIRALGERYGCPVGFSDHTLGITAPQFAVLAGATLIEKHFTYSKLASGPDHAMSLEPAEFRAMVESIHIAEEALGEPVWSAVATEADILQYRRNR